jgi:hypothetical protein
MSPCGVPDRDDGGRVHRRVDLAAGVGNHTLGWAAQSYASKEAAGGGGSSMLLKMTMHHYG